VDRLVEREDTGAAAVEFSLIAALLFLLIFGILQYGLAFNRQQGLHAAAREGARLASFANDVTDTEVRERVRAAAPRFILDPENDLAITVTPANWCANVGAGQTVTVTVGLADDEAVKAKYRVKLPGFTPFLPELTSSATFLCESVRG
jgi:Flp pilus assembly protein TadG